MRINLTQLFRDDWQAIAQKAVDHALLVAKRQLAMGGELKCLGEGMKAVVVSQALAKTTKRGDIYIYTLYINIINYCMLLSTNYES